MHKVEIAGFGDDHPLAQAMASLVWYAMRKGITHVGESMTILIPPMDIGLSEETAKNAGEWELRLKKVAE